MEVIQKDMKVQYKMEFKSYIRLLKELDEEPDNKIGLAKSLVLDENSLEEALNELKESSLAYNNGSIWCVTSKGSKVLSILEEK